MLQCLVLVSVPVTAIDCRVHVQYAVCQTLYAEDSADVYLFWCGHEWGWPPWLVLSARQVIPRPYAGTNTSGFRVSQTLRALRCIGRRVPAVW